jgi:hypothetical protein
MKKEKRRNEKRKKKIRMYQNGMSSAKTKIKRQWRNDHRENRRRKMASASGMWRQRNNGGEHRNNGGESGVAKAKAMKKIENQR